MFPKADSGSRQADNSVDQFGVFDVVGSANGLEVVAAEPIARFRQMGCGHAHGTISADWDESIVGDGRREGRGISRKFGFPSVQPQCKLPMSRCPQATAHGVWSSGVRHLWSPFHKRLFNRHKEDSTHDDHGRNNQQRL